MTTSLATSLPWPLAGCTYDNTGGNDLRNGTVTPFFYDPGVVTGGSIGLLGGVVGGTGLVVKASSGMTVSVSAGHFVVPNTASPTAGGYAATLPSSGPLTLDPADTVNPRIDVIVAGVADNGDSTSNGFVMPVTGTPAASPFAPPIPANSFVVATITVPAGATTITTGNITGNLNFTTATGGVLVCKKTSPPQGYFGQIGYDWPNFTFFHNAPNGPAQLQVLPVQPVTAVLSGGNFSLTTTMGQVPGLSASVVTDGATDLKVTAHIAGFTGLSSAVTYVTMAVFIDGSLADQSVVSLTASNTAQGGLTLVTYTSLTFGNRPSAGAHTVSVQASSSSASGGSPQVHAFSGLPASAWLRVEASGR